MPSTSSSSAAGSAFATAVGILSLKCFTMYGALFAAASRSCLIWISFGVLSSLTKNMAPEDSSLGWSKPAPGRDDWRVIIVVSGTEELLPVFDKDAELSSRFSTIVRAQQLGFTPPAAFKEFRGVLKHMVAHEELTGWLVANDNDLAARIMLACNGHLRLLEKLLQRTATLWTKAGKNRDLPPLALLAQAFPAINSSGATNPFELAPEELQNRVASALRQSNNQHKDWS